MLCRVSLGLGCQDRAVGQHSPPCPPSAEGAALVGDPEGPRPGCKLWGLEQMLWHSKLSLHLLHQHSM